MLIPPLTGKGALEGLVGLEADDCHPSAVGVIDVAGAGMAQDARNDLGLHIQHAALGALLLQQLQKRPTAYR